ncbi:MAG: HD domain-containing phosphohydrolase [Candidatus Aminicenantales bacterium]
MTPIIYFDNLAARRERIVRGCAVLSIAVRPVPSLAEAGAILASDDRVELFLAAFPRLDAAKSGFLEGLKSARPGLSIIVLADGEADRLVVGDVLAGILPPAAEPAVPAFVRCELLRRAGQAKAEACGRMLRTLKSERSRQAGRAAEIEAISAATLENLMTALDLRDVETFGHSQTVAKYAQVLARIMGLRDEGRLDDIHKGALLHDIGKIAIPDAILKKPGALSAGEWEKIRLHPGLGFGLIREIKMVRVIGEIILHHHERCDGTGYPGGLKKNRIPLEARIFALADALDAITAHRPYRRARDFKAARAEILRGSGTHFDPDVVEAFLSLKPEKWEKIRFETTSRLPPVADFSQMFKKIKD